MKYCLTLFLLCFSTVIYGRTFWENCPGPRCPAVTPKSEIKSYKSLEKMDTHELNEREMKLKQELEEINTEKQRRETDNPNLEKQEK